MTVQDLLTAVADLNASIDALIAKIQPAQDLQPVADAIGALKQKVDQAVAG